MAELAVAAEGSVIGGYAISGAVLTATGTLTAGAMTGWIAGSLVGQGVYLAPANIIPCEFGNCRC